MKIVTVICWLIAAGALVGLALWFLTGTVFGIRSDKWDKTGWGSKWSSGFNIGGLETLTGPYNAVGEQTIPASGINGIDARWITGSVDVRPYDGTEIKIVEYAQRELAENEKMYVSTSGGTLSIKYTKGTVVGFMPTKRLELLIPDALCANLGAFSVDATSASINVRGVGAVSFEVDSTSGSVDVSNINAQKFSANTTSGAIAASSSRADAAKFDTSSGSIRATGFTAAKIECDTTSGSISLEGDFGDVDLDSISGRMTLDNAASGSAVKISTTSGTIEMTGSFDTVRADTVSGSVSIRSSVVPSSLRVGTTSGGVKIYVPGGEAVSVNHSSVSGGFSSDVPVTMESRGARFNISTVSGRTQIFAGD